MRKIQTKLLVLSLACITCIIFFAVLVVRPAYVEYVSLSNFQLTSQVSLEAGLLAKNMTDERQAAYNASTFTGEGTPAELLEKYKTATENSRASLQHVQKLAATNGHRFSVTFKEALTRALEGDAPLAELRKEILDPSRPQVSDLGSPLKSKALATYDIALAAQANFLPVAAMETQDGALVRKILTRDNIARLQKDVWKMRGIVTSTLRKKAIEASAPAELAMKMMGEADHIARLRALADPEVIAILDRIVNSADYALFANHCRAIRARESVNSADGVPAEEARAFQTGPSARLEILYNELSTTASRVIQTYTADRLASARIKLVFDVCLAVFTIVSITVLIVYIARSITRPLHHVSSELGITAARATQSAEIIAQSSGSLSDDACEQAAALEEISSSMNELSSMNTANLGHVRKMAKLAENALHSTERGMKNMDELSEAIVAIKQSTGDVASILKTIDEIAFQTNILALNAAVEAARAGEAGAGFAVVADEVRSLAQRSAKAAQETASKIESAVKNSAQGEGLGKRAATRFQEISSITNEYNKTVKEIEASSNQSSQGLAQVNEAIQKVDHITQRTAASSEENAAAAAEMRAQVGNVFEHIQLLEAMILSQDKTHAQDRQATSDASSESDSPVDNSAADTPQPIAAASHRDRFFPR